MRPLSSSGPACRQGLSSRAWWHTDWVSTASPAASGRPSAVSWPWWVALGVVLLGIALVMPPTGDDWNRIHAAGDLHRVLEVSKVNYLERNGRVVANAVSYLLMEPLWLRALLKAVTVLALVAVLMRITGLRTVWGMLVCLAGVVLLPANVFRQSYAWSTGFFFYVPPMIGLLLLVGALAGRGPGDRSCHRVPWAVACGVLGMLTCLFMEHVTVAAAGLAVGGLGVMLARRHRPRATTVGWVVGVVTGTAIMFAAPGMRLTATGDQERYSAPGSINDLLVTAVENYSEVSRAFVLSAPVTLAIVLATGLLIGLRTDRSGPGPRSDGRLAGMTLVVGTLVVAGWALVSRGLFADRLRCLGTDAPCDGVVLAIDLGVLALLLGLLVLVAARALRDGPDRAVWWGLLAATLLMLGPLLVVSPIGPRNIFGPLLTLAGMVAITGGRLLEGTGGPLPGGRAVLSVGRGVLILGVVAGLGWVGAIQVANGRVAAERAEILTQAVQEKQTAVQLPAFPYPRWVHDNEDAKLGNHWFREHRGDISLHFDQP